MKYYSALKKKEILPFVTTWMNPGGIMSYGISQTESYKYCMDTSIWKYIYSQVTETESRMIITRR